MSSIADLSESVLDTRTEKDKVRAILSDKEYHSVMEIRKRLPSTDPHSLYRMLEKMWYQGELVRDRRITTHFRLSGYISQGLLYYALKR